MAAQSLDFPNAESLRRLALNDSGFVFDPVTGNSFSVNPAGLSVLRLIQQTLDIGQITRRLAAEFAVDAAVAERDVIEFAGQLRRNF